MHSINFIDGTLTREKSWPNIHAADPDFVKIMREEEGFPYWEDFEFEFHLMVSDPAQYTQQWISAGAKRIIVHYESFGGAEKAISFITTFQDQFGRSDSLIGTELGIAIDMATPIDVLEPLTEHVDCVQFMSIDSDGKQGEQFNPNVLEKIKTFKTHNPDVLVNVDGGVNLENAVSLIGAGANRLVVGSAIFRSNDIPGTIEELENL